MKLGIIGAMDIEIALILERMDVAATHSEAGIGFVEGTLAGLDVVVARCGVGKVAAAACAQLLVSRCGVTHLLNTGIAGAIDPSLEICDVVVADRSVYYDVNVNHYAYELGQIPGMPTAFYADDVLKGALTSAARKAGGAQFEGPIVTGDCFVVSADQKSWLHETFHALCCDMEGAAIGQVAHMNGIPFAVVRTISDKADGTTDENLDNRAAKLAADIVCEAAEMLA